MSFPLDRISPAFSAAIVHLSQAGPVRALNESLWIFSLIETFHLLFMASLGGAVFALNLRLLGVLLPTVPARDIEWAARPWLWLGIGGTIATGSAMALATAVSTVASAAFVVKMIALLSAILFSLVVSRRVRNGAGETSGTGLAAAAIVLWLAATALFASTENLGSGALLVAATGLVLFAAVVPDRRFAYLAVLLPLLGLGLGGSLFLPTSAEGDRLAHNLTLGSVILALVWSAVIWRQQTVRGTARLQPTTLIAFASTLAWITVAAAGRWIGFS